MKRLFSLVIGLVLGAVIATHLLPASAQTDVCTPDDATPQAVTSGQRLIGQSDYADMQGGDTRLTTTQITLAPAPQHSLS